jgi:predicted amidophosphoribosyltransferase
VPCTNCNTRQTDPERGPSAWRRLVRGGEQVLVCPTCARQPGWDEEADRCPACGSTSLRKALGVIRCSACGWANESKTTVGTVLPQRRPDLADEVAAAVERVLGRAGVSGT